MVQAPSTISCVTTMISLIQNHVAPSHGPPARVLSPLFFQAKSLLLPKLHGKKEQPKATWSTLSPKPWGPHSAKAACSSACMAAMPGFKSYHQSSSAAPFLTPPTISYTCQHSHILSALLGCHSKSGQVWPPGVEPIISKLSLRHCNQGELLPSHILGGSHFHLPGSKQGHSYLTYP